MGLQFDDSKFDFLSDILRQRIEQCKCGYAAAYLTRLSGIETGPQEVQALAEQLTVAETYFFRNPDHFRAFTEAALPACVQARKEQYQLRIVSAGCASGEEAYSLAILIRERFAELSAWNIRIQGFDINSSIIVKAQRARYAAWSLRGTADGVRSRWFRADGRDFILDENLRSLVSFETRNLVEDAPDFWTPQSLDIVFCCNVTMYFSLDVTRAVIARIARAIRPGGYLFLGHAENLRGISQDFHLCHTHGTFYYQRRDASDLVNAVDAPQISAPVSPRVTPSLAAMAPDESWVDTIQRTSDRIALLAQNHGKPSAQIVNKSQPMTPPANSARVTIDGLESAMKLLHGERFNEAMDALDALPGQGKDDSDGRLLRAVILTNGGMLDAARQACKEILTFDEMNAGAHYLMAMCSEHAGNRAAAVEHNQAAVHLDPGFAMAHFHLGLLAKRSGDLETARRELTNAMPLLFLEDAARILLFGGGFTRDALVSLCRSELRTIGTAS
jgi:chemotaxis protein methyltransferase CheR